MLDRADILNKSFASLPTATKQELAATLRPSGAFTEEQRELMENLWLLVADTAQLEALNEQNPIAQMGVRSTKDGRSLLPVDLLTDCRPGETYDHARDFLFSLQIVEVLPSEFPQPESINFPQPTIAPI